MAFATLRDHALTVGRVVLIGPAHYVYFRGLALPNADVFETPLGPVPVARDAASVLDDLAFIVRADAPHAPEHALEVELPFLQVLLPDGVSAKRWQREPPQSWRTSYRRRALAEWLTDVDQGAGRLLARVINVDTIPYPKLNLGAQDTVYWWVDGVGGRLRSVLISSRPDADLLLMGFNRVAHPEQRKGFRWRQAQARFGWRDTDEMLWVACDWAECCQTGEAFQ